MYTTCLFCHGSLGRNEALERFPVSQRVAFDPERGRLWAICPRCRRWNLSPIETRWEAIEEAERAFRASRERISTDNVAMARAADGTALVRIGRPTAPELATWRYRTLLGRRYWRHHSLMAAMPGASLASAAMILSGVNPDAITAVLGMGIALQTGALLRMRNRARAPRLWVRGNDGNLLAMTAWDASRTELARHDGEASSIFLAHRVMIPPGSLRRALGRGARTSDYAIRTPLSGDVARRALALIIPTVNHWGGTRRDVRDAVDLVAGHRDFAGAMMSRQVAWGTGEFKRPSSALGSMNTAHRLALEMALHDADERRAMEGELSELEDRWRDAEEIAAIADGLLTATADARLATMRETRLP